MSHNTHLENTLLFPEETANSEEVKVRVYQSYNSASRLYTLITHQDGQTCTGTPSTKLEKLHTSGFLLVHWYHVLECYLEVLLFVVNLLPLGTKVLGEGGVKELQLIFQNRRINSDQLVPAIYLVPQG